MISQIEDMEGFQIFIGMAELGDRDGHSVPYRAVRLCDRLYMEWRRSIDQTLKYDDYFV